MLQMMATAERLAWITTYRIGWYFSKRWMTQKYWKFVPAKKCRLPHCHNQYVSLKYYQNISEDKDLTRAKTTNSLIMREMLKGYKKCPQYWKSIKTTNLDHDSESVQRIETDTKTVLPNNTTWTRRQTDSRQRQAQTQDNGPQVGTIRAGKDKRKQQLSE